MKIVRAKDFTGPHSWAAVDVANMNGITTRLHWADTPYGWHVNDREEVFAVLDGEVDMRSRVAGVKETVLQTGDVFLRVNSYRGRCASARRRTHSCG